MNDESRTIDEALGKLLKGDSANLTPRELELLNELFEQTPESVFIHWAFKYIRRNPGGGMAEWFMALVLKTGMGAISSWVRIPLPPPFGFSCAMSP